jgi:multisubunit Na+/H+ antiporter MnhG subunit
LHPVAKKCVAYGVLLLVVGAVLIIYIPDLYNAIANTAGSNAQAGLDVVNVVLQVIRSGFMPVGAALIGAAVVIQTLSNDKHSDQDHAEPQG